MEYGSFGTTALKLDIGTKQLSLGPGLAYLYGTFGYTVGKLVGQYSDLGRVSHLQQSLLKEARRAEVPRVQWESEREEPSTSRGGGDWLSVWEPLGRLDSAAESRCRDKVWRRRGGEKLTHCRELIGIA